MLHVLCSRVASWRIGQRPTGNSAVVLANLSGLVISTLTDGSRGRSWVVKCLDDLSKDEPYPHAIGVEDRHDDGWTLLDAGISAQRVGVVIVTSSYEIGWYRRAYAAGAAVAHLDSPLDVIVDVMMARARGEVLCPAALLTSVVSSRTQLLPSERAVLRCIAAGHSVVEAANRTCYSERHVRRLLHSILVKAGTSDRTKAVARFQAEVG
jgi:DNA-binding NarL/FixJ family response regulator